ncbi:MAG TPA: hypothetical protein VEI49_01240 [Terriglobales bacterium]|nr:hypothetical protein [Terriglobales bacterium]
MQNLDGSVALEMLVVGTIDFAHAASADLLNNAVVAQCLADYRVGHAKCHRGKPRFPLTLYQNGRSEVCPGQLVERLWTGKSDGMAEIKQEYGYLRG